VGIVEVDPGAYHVLDGATAAGDPGAAGLDRLPRPRRSAPSAGSPACFLSVAIVVGVEPAVQAEPGVEDERSDEGAGPVAGRLESRLPAWAGRAERTTVGAEAVRRAERRRSGSRRATAASAARRCSAVSRTPPDASASEFGVSPRPPKAPTRSTRSVSIVISSTFAAAARAPGRAQAPPGRHHSQPPTQDPRRSTQKPA
jgi:hypothetical protein